MDANPDRDLDLYRGVYSRDGVKDGGIFSGDNHNNNPIRNNAINSQSTYGGYGNVGARRGGGGGNRASPESIRRLSQSFTRR